VIQRRGARGKLYGANYLESANEPLSSGQVDRLFNALCAFLQIRWQFEREVFKNLITSRSQLVKQLKSLEWVDHYRVRPMSESPGVGQTEPQLIPHANRKLPL
jgi:hypothetical protein